jgi:S-adenosylmethionine:tRNA ribosyltransferase-isomerase
VHRPFSGKSSPRLDGAPVSTAAILDRGDDLPTAPGGDTGPIAVMGTPLPLRFTLDADREAHQPPEASGRRRDEVRLLVSHGRATPIHTTFTSLPDYLQPGDLVVVNTSATVSAAVDVVIGGHGAAVLHVSNELPGDLWMVEPRRRVANGSTERLRLADAPATVSLPDGRPLLHLLRRAPDSQRIWLAVAAADVDLPATMAAVGRPIRYQYVPRDWPLDSYQTVFATEPGSAEMPSAARPFTAEIVTRLVSNGVAISPITLHTGVSSLEAGERPYTERYRVPAATAALANATHRGGGHVIAIGTTVVRALETVTDRAGTVHPGEGWTDVVIDPDRGVRAVDGLLTGWHEPEATHLAMLEAVGGRQLLVLAYESAFAAGYRWHEFGDSHLILPYA